MVLCSRQAVGFHTSNHISKIFEKLFCSVPLGVLEKSLKDSFLLSVSGKDKVVPGRANETTKVKETIKEVKFPKSLGKAAKFCWHSCFFLNKFVLCFHVLHISARTIPASLICSLCWRRQPLQHINERRNSMKCISQRPTAVLQHKSTCFYWSAGGKSGSNDPQLQNVFGKH